MKKTYIKPQTTAMKMESEMPMAASVKMFNTAADKTFDVLVNEVEFKDIWGN